MEGGVVLVVQRARGVFDVYIDEYKEVLNVLDGI